MSETYELEIRVNAEGDTLAYMWRSGDDGGMRIAGPKAWGGSYVIAKLTITEDHLVMFVQDHAPEALKRLVQSKRKRK